MTPTAEQLAYAKEVTTRLRGRALEYLVVGQHIDDIAAMVFSYCADDSEPTPEDIARQILGYLADTIVAFLNDAGGPVVHLRTETPA